MASFKKYKRTLVNKILRHNSRLNKTYSNPDIDPELTIRNVRLIDKGYAGYKERLQELNYVNRKDLVSLCEWVVTMPETAYAGNAAYNFNDYRDGERSLEGSNTLDLAADITAFLCNRYGEENCIQAILHVDESGSTHLHFAFIPVKEDQKNGGEKICAKEVIDRHELQTFHADLRDYLNQQQRDGKIKLRPSETWGISKDNLSWRKKMTDLGVMQPGSQIRVGDLFFTGVTKAQGGNRTVREMKQERELQHEIERTQESRWGYTRDMEYEIER